eukprot:COSAG01_NODE_32692_length_577_cov_0.922594_2_plen_60_part_01
MRAHVAREWAGSSSGGSEGVQVGLGWLSAPEQLSTRCMEYHSYTVGGGLVCAGHRDAGSA